MRDTYVALLLVLGFFVVLGAGMLAEPYNGADATQEERAPESRGDWWEQYDTIVHVISDTQPNDDHSDSGGRYDSYGSVKKALSLLDRHVRFTPEYIVIPGDATDYTLDRDRKEIDSAYETLSELSWFYEADTGNTLYVAGNHEFGGYDYFFETFNNSDPTFLQTLSFGNFVFYGLNPESGSRDYKRAIRQLESELERMDRAGEKKNVVLFFHHTFPGTVSNCHDRPVWNDSSASAMNEVLDRYGGNYVVAAFSGDIHGSMFDPNTVLEATHKEVKFVNAGVFSSGNVTDEDGNCEDEDAGIYESQFMGIEQGANTIDLYRHQTFFDKDRDGENDIRPRWRYDYNSRIELAYPAEVEN